MSHQRRLHVAGAYYYINHHCSPGQELFAKEEDYQQFSELFSESLVRYRMKAHAFLWRPCEIRMLVEIDDVPLFHFMRSLTPLIVFRITGTDTTSRLFTERYSALLIDPVEYLLRAIRDIHYRELQEPGVETLGDYKWSSHRCYTGEETLAWMTTHKALGSFNRHKRYARPAYATFMQTPPSAEDVDTFSRVHGSNRRALGGSIFLHRMGLRPTTTLEAVAQLVSKRMGVDLEEVHTSPRRSEFAEVHVAIALRAKGSNVASFAAVARYMGLSSSTLHDLIKTHRAVSSTNHGGIASPRPGSLLSPAAITSLLARPAMPASGWHR